MPSPAVSAARRAALGLAVAALLPGCGGGERTAADAPGGAPGRPEPPPAAWLVDRAAEAGLDFVHYNGMTGRYYMAEVTGAGGALVDVDGDSDLDVYLVQGALLGPDADPAESVFPAPAEDPPLDRLYRNLLVETGTLRFEDVTAASGIRADGYGMGVAAGDVDSDGDVDLYVTNFGPNQLWLNRGDGTFEDATAASGTAEDRWSVPATFFDFDRDGHLDLFVGNYIAADLSNRTICRDLVGGQDYCGPGSFDPLPDRLLRNRGDGTFEDVTAARGMTGGWGGALGVVAADFDGDGRADLYVANDGMPNNLWMQQEDGSFRDEALVAGCAVNAQGKAEASMGTDTGDVDGDGDLDLFMAHLTGETNTLFLNDGGGLFVDGTLGSGLGPPSRPFTSFGTGFLDVDGDGWLDLVLANGAVKKIEALARAGDPFPVHQPNQLFRNRGDGTFEEVSGRAPALALSETSRGLAFGDVDADGDTDVLLANNSGPARLLLDESPEEVPWLGLRLLVGDPGRDALGALVRLEGPGPVRVRRVRTDGSYCSASDPRVLFALPAGDTSERSVLVTWPDGRRERFAGLVPGRYTTLRQGGGEEA